MKCDVSKEEDILSMMSEIKSQLGGVDICVNNAALAKNAPLLSGTTEQWRQMMEVRIIHYLSAWASCKCLSSSSAEAEEVMLHLNSNRSLKLSWGNLTGFRN